MLCQDAPAGGSPPRGRGRQRRRVGDRELPGLTPAWAGTARPTCPKETHPWAHPRVGGDGHSTSQGVLRGRGSPPRGRGRLGQSGHVLDEGGLTPAWAGTASARASRSNRAGAHPRVGGDGLDGAAIPLRREGSPPRGRGRPWRCIHEHLAQGLTPAWAGTARTHARRAWPARGSPPRGRGRHPDLVSEPMQRGLTPAWAGTAEQWGAWDPVRWAHPRVGGDGVEHSDDSCARAGLTPAWAGTAGTRTGTGSGSRAHPRVGGDGRLQAAEPDRATGSPPRGRGRHALVQRLALALGLTPAWAGTASARRATSAAGWAHPRVGGDGGRYELAGIAETGSPPRGRGRPLRVLAVDVQHGLTPAWAGTASRTVTSTASPWAHPRVGGDGWLPSARL